MPAAPHCASRSAFVENDHDHGDAEDEADAEEATDSPRALVRM
jgi:hypothetical protein